MSKINRKNLTKFLKRILRNRRISQQEDEAMSFDSQSTDKDYYNMCSDLSDINQEESSITSPSYNQEPESHNHQDSISDDNYWTDQMIDESA